MTFNQGEVVSITKIDFSQPNPSSGVYTIYTVPAGKYAVIQISGIGLGYTLPGTAGADYRAGDSSFFKLGDGSTSVNPATIDDDISNPKPRTFTLALAAGESITLNITATGGSGSGSATVDGLALEYNNP